MLIVGFIYQTKAKVDALAYLFSLFDQHESHIKHHKCCREYSSTHEYSSQKLLEYFYYSSTRQFLLPSG